MVGTRFRREYFECFSKALRTLTMDDSIYLSNRDIPKRRQVQGSTLHVSIFLRAPLIGLLRACPRLPLVHLLF